MGEAGLLSELARRTPAGGDDILLGPGDDAAVVMPPPGAAMVITQDAVVEDVDFRRAWATPHAVGRRALVLSLSDLAGMGARPLWFVASVCAPPSTCVDDLLALHLGLLDAGAEPGCRLVGGDLSAIEGPLVVDVCAVGAVAPGAALRRDAGRPGDLLVVTGTLGRAAAGLRLATADAMTSGGPPAWSAERGDDALWEDAQVRPVARLDEGLALVAAGVRCGGDVSDGLLVDADRTAAASGCAAELWVDHLPVDAGLRTRFGDGWLELAIGGGEDFELLAAVDPERVDGLLEEWPEALAPLSVVGRLVEGSGVRLRAGTAGPTVDLPPVRSRHFTS